MGYTHYWTQKKTFSKADWKTVCQDIAAILQFTETNLIVLGDGLGEGEPEITESYIAFNGSATFDQDHETFSLSRIRPELQEWREKRLHGWDFTKTARKPYDVAVTACLIYLETVFPKHIQGVSSDGTGLDWIAGLELVREAVPQYGNQYDLPMAVMVNDRWKYGYGISFGINESDYDMRECVNGKVYVMDRKDVPVFAFENVDAAKKWIASMGENLYCGYSNPQNRRSVKNRQNNVFRNLWITHESADYSDLPDYVRPMPSAKAA